MKDNFSVSELQIVIDELKNWKAKGLDHIYSKKIENFGLQIKKWVLDLFNGILFTQVISKIWRRTKIIALLKPEKSPDDPKNFRPTSLLCHLYKTFERLILNRLKVFIDDKLIRDQGGFRPGRTYTG